VDLKHLRYFIALAEELHFGRAAERLGISQPPLSQQIARLEKELGVSLLRRTSRSVELTAGGRAFLEEARRTLVQAEHAVHVARGADRGEVGELRVGFVPSCGAIPRGVRRFTQQYPAVRLTLRNLTTADQLDELASGKLHVGFVHLPIDSRGLNVELVQQDSVLAAIPERHPLARQPSISLRAFAGEPFIGFPRGAAPGLYDYMITSFREAGFTARVAHETDSILARLRMVGAGLGLSLIPSYGLRLPRPGVVLRPLKPVKLVSRIGMVHAARYVTPAVTRFLTVVREVSPRARAANGERAG
jgi:DNA-binding transcriptional LysR family regulator